MASERLEIIVLEKNGSINEEVDADDEEKGPDRDDMASEMESIDVEKNGSLIEKIDADVEEKGPGRDDMASVADTGRTGRNLGRKRSNSRKLGRKPGPSIGKILTKILTTAALVLLIVVVTFGTGYGVNMVVHRSMDKAPIGVDDQNLVDSYSPTPSAEEGAAVTVPVRTVYQTWIGISMNLTCLVCFFVD